MIRKASRDDLPRIFEIRAAVKENRLSDPSRVTREVCEWFIDHAAFWLWEHEGEICGFSAGDPRDGTIFALFIDPKWEGRGIGQVLLPLACKTLRDAGHRLARLDTEAGSRAERFYRQSGWREVGRKADGQIIFERCL
jgi:GNAT superfamily N-acetyltransferase